MIPSIKNKSQKSYYLPSLTSSKSSVCKSASLVVLLTQLSLVSFSNAQQKSELKLAQQTSQLRKDYAQWLTQENSSQKQSKGLALLQRLQGIGTWLQVGEYIAGYDGSGHKVIKSLSSTLSLGANVEELSASVSSTQGRLRKDFSVKWAKLFG